MGPIPMMILQLLGSHMIGKFGPKMLKLNPGGLAMNALSMLPWVAPMLGGAGGEAAEAGPGVTDGMEAESADPVEQAFRRAGIDPAMLRRRQ
jgi:hypothetical protein